jgi:hypothetical protein
MGQAAIEIRRVEVVFAGNPDQGEQSIAPGIGEGGSHPVRAGGLGDRADRPVRGNPLARRMRQGDGQPDQTGRVIDRGGLHRRNLMPTQGLADPI